MLLSTIAPKIPAINTTTTTNNNCLINHLYKFSLLSNHYCRADVLRPTTLINASPSLANGISEEKKSLQTPKANANNEILHHVSHSGEEDLVTSMSALSAAIRKASTSPVEFIQRTEKDGTNRLVLPSSDFQSLCSEQLELFRRIVDQEVLLSIYVRPAGSYIMDRLELRRVTFYSGLNVAERGDIVVLISNFSIPTGLRVAEAALSNQQVVLIPECRAVVFPMVKHPFVVGFLVAEFPAMELKTCKNVQGDGASVQPGPASGEPYMLSPRTDRNLWELNAFEEDVLTTFHHFTAEQISSVINISRSMAMAYIMDQKSVLLQQSSWQNNVRMSYLVEQIRGPLSSIRTLSQMLSVHVKRSEISYDIVEDILVQGDRLRDTLEQLQDAVYLTKANIVRYNEETLRKMNSSTYVYPESARSRPSNTFSRESPVDKSINLGEGFSLSSTTKDLEMPMPPHALAALQQHSTRPCNVSDVLADLVGAVEPLARKQQKMVELRELSQTLQVCVEESALRQALSNLIEGALLRTRVGGKVEIISTRAPAGGALILIDDDGPDMHYMTQMHSLTPFGANLFSEGTVEDNMTWNFVAGLTVAREILESYGCVVRVISPLTQEAAFGTGGTRIELWLPSLTSDLPSLSQEV